MKGHPAQDTGALALDLLVGSYALHTGSQSQAPSCGIIWQPHGKQRQSDIRVRLPDSRCNNELYLIPAISEKAQPP